jgi:hypothetical protein
MFRPFVFAGIAILLSVAVSAGTRYREAQDRVTAIEAEHSALDSEWQAIAPKLSAALAVRSTIEAEQRQLARISEARSKPRWAPALRCIVPTAEAGIEIHEIQARRDPTDFGACELRISGSAGGSQPRLGADLYRKAIEEALMKDAAGRSVSTRFEQLNDVPEELAEKERVTFVLIATLDRQEPAVAERRGRR